MKLSHIFSDIPLVFEQQLLTVLNESFDVLDASELEDLLSAVEYEQEEVDNASYADDADDAKLEKDYKALEAVATVIKNNQIALDKPELMQSSIFLYNYQESGARFAVAAVQIWLEKSIAHVKWLGSYGLPPGSGKKLLLAGLEQAKLRGATKTVVDSKWESEGFYHKLGYDVLHRGDFNPFSGSRLVKMGRKLEEHTVVDRLMTRNPMSLFKHSDRQLDSSVQFEKLDQDVDGFVIYETGNVVAYLLVQNYQGNHWMLESYTAPAHRRKGLNSLLIDSAVKKYGRVFADMMLTPESIRMLETYVRRTPYKVQRFDTTNGELHDYNSSNETDQQFPMYNKAVAGVNRPSDPAAEKWVWCFSIDKPRHPLLMGYVTSLDKFNKPEKKLTESWSKKYKKSINCNNPRGFSQRAHCAARRKRRAGGTTKSKSVRENRLDTLVESILSHLQTQGLTEAAAVAHIHERLDEDLQKWFKQKWVRFGPDGKIRGACARGSESEGKPKCLPQKKAWALGRKKRATAARRKRREDPNPERKGRAKNVATKENVGCPHCGGPVVAEEELVEKKDACYYKVKSRYKVWPSAYASGALVQCRKKGAQNWGKGKK